ncbi:MAG: hybrid sensor histidine kinase/response regulator [Candidatus Cyclonatronum sp.]|uniref:hybrid sensor histidine kinase/response regulator n=1 Tax=Cyclonatronum sp. TaxID=3024185 RepID=UPI0025BA06D6|nr:hybrid sensor histidine kinase/response regulator [Cyclonatronum sp.]MCC5933166.1 hybrid sensor histidine kinase/response regulator [Balneolales bacterium]MCH8485554.1 hybrid sensor histidine kinase/response regulator [Cyclonatronum sp.]
MNVDTNAPYPASVLVVDDNPRNLQLISTLLAKSGYKVSAVNSGIKAIKFVKEKKPDLILLDVMMPEMNGYETCNQIRLDAEADEIPIIFLTAKSEIEDIITGFKQGAVDYITKPFKSEEVLIRLKTHLQLRASRAQLREKNAELEKLNKELIETRAIIKEDANRLKALNAEKDRFFSIIAHDLRGPLSGTMGLAEILSNNARDISIEDIVEYSTALYSSTSDMYKLLLNLLDWARLQMGLVSYKPTDIKATQLIQEGLSMYEAMAKEKKLTINQNVEDDLTLYVDHNMINSIMRNLISNAIKFTPKNGKIEIRAFSNSPDTSIIEVSDSGIGIPLYMQDKLFRLDENVSRSGTEGEESTGIGLLLCRDIAEKNKGKLSFESEEGIGSTFRVELPAIKAE